MDPQPKHIHHHNHNNTHFVHEMEITVTPPCAQLQKSMEIVARVLQVDKQLKVETLTKDIQWDQEIKQIRVKFCSRQLKLLRACVTGFLRHMQLVVATIHQFPS